MPVHRGPGSNGCHRGLRLPARPAVGSAALAIVGADGADGSFGAAVAFGLLNEPNGFVYLLDYLILGSICSISFIGSNNGSAARRYPSSWFILIDGLQLSISWGITFSGREKDQEMLKTMRGAGHWPNGRRAERKDDDRPGEQPSDSLKDPLHIDPPIILELGNRSASFCQKSGLQLSKL